MVRDTILDTDERISTIARSSSPEDNCTSVSFHFAQLFEQDSGEQCAFLSGLEQAYGPKVAHAELERLAVDSVCI